MSDDDIYADDSLDVLQGNEIGESGPALHAPDAHRLAVTHHHDADYGPPDTTVTIAEDSSGATLSCSHDGMSYGSGETVVVPLAVARFWVRSGWATAEAGTEPGDYEPEPLNTVSASASAPETSQSRRQVSARRRSAKR